MSFVCPSCDKNFSSDKSLDEHILKSHLQSLTQEQSSTISKTYETEPDFSTESSPSPLNLKKIFSEEKFEKLTLSKMNSVLDDDEKLMKQNFIEQIKRINRKNPFLYMPYFITDFMNGVSTNELEKKYHILHWMDHRNVTHNILEFKERRFISRHYENAFELNLKNIDWKNKFSELQKNCIYFKNELVELVFDNVIQAGIIFLLMDKKLEKNEIYDEIKKISNDYDLFRFIDKELAIEFNKLLQTNLNERVDDILTALKKEGVIKREGLGSRKLKTSFSINEIKKAILNELKYEEEIRYPILRNIITSNFPGLRIIPKFNVFRTAWKELEHDKLIHVDYSRGHRESDCVMYLREVHDKINSDIQMLDKNTQKIPFKGRKITPDQFISELLELQKGDLDDEDDQVTRIAGLVLAESVKLQSPHEEIKEFDFSIDLNDYDFRPEQEDAMVKINFQIISKIFHIKVMIDEVLDLEKYNELKEKLPQNQQGVVITFKKIPKNVLSIMKNDPSIQIIDEEGIKIWVSITHTLPARVNSICKISSDPLSKLENKIVQVNSIFYEKGIAIVNIIPKMKEQTVLVRSLEEIRLFESEVSNFELYTKNYLEFLTILSVLTKQENMIDGFFKNKFILDEKKSTLSKKKYKVKFDYSVANLDLLGIWPNEIQCNCMQYAENRLFLCSHLVSSLDYVFREFSFGDKTWSEKNILRKVLQRRIQKNLITILDRLGIYKEGSDIVVDNKIFSVLSDYFRLKVNS